MYLNTPPPVLVLIGSLVLCSAWGYFAGKGEQLLWPLLIAVACVIVANCFAQQLSRIVGVLPLVSSIAMAGLIGECATCGSRNFLYLAPAFGALISCALIICINFNIARVAVKDKLVTLLATIGSLGHVVLLCLDPKVCPFCVAFFFAMVAILFSISWTQKICEKSISLPSPARAWALFVALLIFALHSSVALGVIEPTYGIKRVTFRSFVGTSLSKYVTNWVGKNKNSRLFVIVQSGCGACEKAERGLKELSVPYSLISICTIGSDGGCFRTPSPVPTPTFLVVDPRGMIVKQFQGWPSSKPAQVDLLAQLGDIQ